VQFEVIWIAKARECEGKELGPELSASGSHREKGGNPTHQSLEAKRGPFFQEEGLYVPNFWCPRGDREGERARQREEENGRDTRDNGRVRNDGEDTTIIEGRSLNQNGKLENGGMPESGETAWRKRDDGSRVSGEDLSIETWSGGRGSATRGKERRCGWQTPWTQCPSNVAAFQLARAHPSSVYDLRAIVLELPRKVDNIRWHGLRLRPAAPPAHYSVLRLKPSGHQLEGLRRR
jgi:hypothetical protein